MTLAEIGAGKLVTLSPAPDFREKLESPGNQYKDAHVSGGG